MFPRLFPFLYILPMKERPVETSKVEAAEEDKMYTSGQMQIILFMWKMVHGNCELWFCSVWNEKSHLGFADEDLSDALYFAADVQTTNSEWNLCIKYSIFEEYWCNFRQLAVTF